MVTRTTAEAGQTNLWGEQEIEQALLPEKAEVSDYIRQQLAGEKRLFGAVEHGCGRAETDARAATSSRPRRTSSGPSRPTRESSLYDKLSERTGPIDDILNQAAQSLATGEPNAAVQAKIKRDAHAAVRDHLTAQFSILTGGATNGRSSPSRRHDAGKGHLQLAPGNQVRPLPNRK